MRNIPETATLLLAKNQRANTLTSTNYSFLKVVHRYAAVIKRENQIFISSRMNPHQQFIRKVSQQREA